MKGLPKGYHHWVTFPGSGQYLNPEINVNGQKSIIEGHLTEILTQESIKFIDERNREKPFFLALMHKTPKSPYEEHQIGIASNLDERAIKMPPSFNNGFEKKPEYLKNAYETLERDSTISKNYLSGYYKHIIGLDQSVGEIISYLESENILDETLVIFTSDHGFMHYEFNVFGKRLPYEPSLKIPLFIRYPSWFGDGNHVSDEFTSIVDILPTLMDAANIENENIHLPGISLKHLSQGLWRRKYNFSEYQFDPKFNVEIPSYRVINSKNSKYIRYYNSVESDEYYDLDADPFELDNMYDLVSDTLQVLPKALDSIMYSIGDLTSDINFTKNRLDLIATLESYDSVILQNTGMQNFYIDSIHIPSTSLLVTVSDSTIRADQNITLKAFVQTVNFTDFGCSSITIYDKKNGTQLSIPTTLSILASSEDSSKQFFFPNPTSGNFHLVSEKNIVDLSIVDLQGKVLPYSLKRILNVYTIEILNKVNGIHLVKVIYENGEVNLHKIIFKDD